MRICNIQIFNPLPQVPILASSKPAANKKYDIKNMDN